MYPKRINWTEIIKDHTTPVWHINEQLKTPTELPKVILISTGSYNPSMNFLFNIVDDDIVHKMHIEMLRLAKNELESTFKFKVLGAYISPSHEDYVSYKLKDDYIYTELRLEMCKLAIKESGHSDWIQVDPWEATQSRFYDFPEVVFRMDDFVKKTWPNEKISNSHSMIINLYKE